MPTAIAARTHRLSAAVLAASAGLGAAAVLPLPGRAWLAAALAPVFGIGVFVAEARRGAAAAPPRVRHVPGE